MKLRIQYPSCRFGVVELEGELEEFEAELELNGPIRPTTVAQLTWKKMETVFGNTANKDKPSTETKPTSKGASIGGALKEVTGIVLKVGEKKKTTKGDVSVRIKMESEEGRALAFTLFDVVAKFALIELEEGNVITVKGKIRKKEYEGNAYWDMYPAELIAPVPPEEEAPNQESEPGEEDIPF